MPRNKPNKWQKSFKNSPRSSNTQERELGVWVNDDGNVEPIDVEWKTIGKEGVTVDQGKDVALGTGVTLSSPSANNLTVTASGTTTVNGALTVEGTFQPNNIAVDNGGNIGSAGDADAMSIAADGQVTFSQNQNHSGQQIVNSQTVNDLQSGASYRFDGSNDVVTVGDDNNIDFGNGDYSFGCWFKTSTTSTSYLVSKYLDSTGKGVNLYIYSNAIRWWSGDGTDSYALQGSTVVNDGNWHHVVAVMDRDNADNVKIYLDGIAESATATGTLSDLGSVDNAGDLSIGARHDGSRLDGEIRQVRLHNRALTAAEVRAAYNGQAVGFEYVGASQATKEASDWSADADGYSASQGTVDFNQDGVSDGAASENDCLRYYANATSTNHQVIKTIGTIGKRYRVSGKVYIPNSGGSQYLDGVQINNDGNYNVNVVATITTLGSWQSFSGEILWGYDSLRIRARKGGSYSFAGQNSATDDVFYLKDFEITQIGCVAEYLPESISSSSWLDSSGNQLNGSVSGATATNADNNVPVQDGHLMASKSVTDLQSGASFKFDGSNDVVTVSNNSNLQLVGADYSASVWFKTSTSAGTILGKGASSNWAWEIHVASSKLKADLLQSGGSVYLTVTSGQDINDNEWHNATFSYTHSNTTLSLYIDGVLVGIDNTTSGSQSSGTGNVTFGENGAASNDFDGEIRQARLHNRALSADEVRASYSGQAVSYEYVGASQTDKISSTLVNNGSYPFNTFQNASANGFEAVKNASGTKVASTADEIAVEAGKKYRIKFDVTLNSGTYPLTRLRSTATSGTWATVVVAGGAANGESVEFDWVSTLTDTLVLSWEATSNVDFAIANLSMRQIGCVAEYLPTGINSTRWIDTSGNGLNGSTSTATAINHTIGSLTVESGATIKLQDGAGIDFSNYTDGSVAGTTTSQLLNDYEEGVWTPFYSSSGASFTYHTDYTGGKYIKIGKLVYVQGTIYTASASSGTAGDPVLLGGLPYNVGGHWNSSLGDSKMDARSTLSFSYVQSFAGDFPAQGEFLTETSTAQLFYKDSFDEAETSLKYSDLNTGATSNYITFSGVYIANT